MNAAAVLDQRIPAHSDLMGECLRRAISMRSRGSRQNLEPDDLPAASVLVTLALDPSTLQEIAAAVDTRTAYERLQSRIEATSSKLFGAAMGLQEIELTDQVWLLLRPTVVAARVTSGQDIPVDEIDSVVPLPVGMARVEVQVAVGDWFAHLRTTRVDDSWWTDRFAARSAGYVRGSSDWTLLCPAGHCLHDSRYRARRYPDTEFHCPVCAGSRAVEGLNSLSDTHPALAAQWDQERNDDLTAGTLLGGSGIKIWWRCAEGHSWQATVFSRTVRLSGCPHCRARAVQRNYADLATTHPDLVRFWDSEIEQKQAHQVSARNSSVKIHLRCKAGHRFVRTPAKLALRPFCTYCDGRTVAVGETDLMTTHPQVASWWHPSKNGTLGPADVKAGSNKRVWWLCPDNHEFQQQINDRTRQKNRDALSTVDASY